MPDGGKFLAAGGFVIGGEAALLATEYGTALAVSLSMKDPEARAARPGDVRAARGPLG
jgi:hypothetical protein